MKKIVIILINLLFFTTMVSAQKSNATLDETINFLTDKLNIYDNNDFLDGAIIISFNKATKTLTYKYTFAMKGNSKSTNIWTFAVQKLNPQNTKLEPTESFNWLYLYSTNKIQNIKFEQIVDGKTVLTNMTNEVWFRISKTAMKPDDMVKVKNSFIRLIELCNGAK